MTDLSLSEFYDAVEAEGRPLLTADEFARRLEESQADADEALSRLADQGLLERVDVESDPVVWYPTEWGELASRERVVVFPERREIVVDRPTQYTQARLSQFAHLVDTTGTEPGTRGYLYRIRPEDVWSAPFDGVADLILTMRGIFPRRYEGLEEWVESQWKRANRFRLYTHEDGYVVLSAATDDLLGNVAMEKLDEDAVRAPISDTEAWVNEDAIAGIKRALYEAGYPVVDDRDLERGDPIDADLTTELREYQQSWVDSFLEKQAGVLVGPPGSGKTVAALGALAEVGGETLILVPSRELAGQWRQEIERHTTVDADQVGEYHGGTKQLRPITIATYQIAGMDRHRKLFDEREWGLIVFDEAHHVPAPVFRQSAALQSKHRLGLTATPVRESDDETDIYTLIGPPLGTDWSALFDAGFVAEPEVELRYLPWDDELAENEWGSAHGRERHVLAGSNPRKIEETRKLLADHDGKALVFVDYLDQGEAIAEELDAAFVSGETPHHRREKLFESFRTGEREALVVSRVGDEGIDLPNAELAVVASGLGGSRRQGAQRAGRTMRPVGRAEVVVLATHGTREEEFARKQMRHLAEKGVRVHETVVGDAEEASGNEGEAIDEAEEASGGEGELTDDDATPE
ncbi:MULTISPECIES: DEAD/DEAH box helicase [Halolamina]|uniref:Putative DNA 3'-5' helicase Rad25 n=1 Tax=Halolamina pelagica TaxID=699431 RepID=A0A1I5VAQ2_9EURY|nr:MULTISPECIES: DEAD/DEAH box helicase [Halolamina]NHX37719.1 DEAD/DEAH box helicase [Halolamina sp. R1-12]SFQ04492.1 DNA excision repair protein ERCC-3 [Halolamina pelagica]